MPHAVTHVLIAIILLEVYRDYRVKNKKAFPLHYVLIGGLAGLLPDLDIVAYYLLYFFGFTLQELHRTFSHNLFVPLVFVLLSVVSYGFKNKKLGEHHLKLRNIFLVIAFGSFVHLSLDALVIGGIVPFYPLSNFSIGLNLIKFVPVAWQESFIPAIDAALLILWLISLEVRHKISSFI